MTEQYGSLKFYIGAVLALASCVTVVGLVATFSSWSMISALSDSNSNTMLRSSMGQYVTAMPSRFVVASLYLFLLWLTMLLIDIVSGPLILVILGVVLYLFFQVVVSLSAFGRLIIHTGAMGKKRVLDPDFERQLLPSGLHASLLIKATERSRRRTSVTKQYQPRNENSERSINSASSHSSRVLGTDRGHNRRETSTISYNSLPSRGSPPEDSLRSLGADEETALKKAAVAFGGNMFHAKSIPSFDEPVPMPMPKYARPESVESVDELVSEIQFPRASLLNIGLSGDQLKSVVNETLSTREREGIRNLVDEAQAEIQREKEAASLRVSTNVSMTRMSAGDLPEDVETPRTAIRKLALRRSLAVSQNEIQLQDEWNEEDIVRSIYEIEPPVEFFDEDEHGFHDDDELLPHPSLLNRSHDLGALKKLMNGVGDLGRSFTSLTRRTAVPRPLNQIREQPSDEGFGKYDELFESEYVEPGKPLHRVHFDEDQPLLGKPAAK